jgi:HD-GYP domain-containing protein (c-di-GMP phosphodiesterase class II)
VLFRSPRIGAKVNRENDYAGYVITNHRFFHLGNLQDVLHGFDRNWTDLLSEFQTYEAIPLLAKGQAKGVLELFFVTPMRMNNEWVTHMYSVASEIAVAMDNLELLEKLGRSNQSLTAAYDATIEGWSRALELRDQETEGHAQRVVDLTLRMAEQVGIPREEWQHIRRGALLHDIGKMAIPDSILFKEGPLDDDEWEIMRRHPLYAYQLLGPIEYLQPALDIPYCHHEHWDGSGYPRGLSGKDIPLAARIFNLVDVWDALRSDRPYRGYWNDDEVLAFLRIQSGKLFDPEMVDIFINMVKKENENPQDLKE